MKDYKQLLKDHAKKVKLEDMLEEQGPVAYLEHVLESHINLRDMNIESLAERKKLYDDAQKKIEDSLESITNDIILDRAYRILRKNNTSLCDFVDEFYYSTE